MSYSNEINSNTRPSLMYYIHKLTRYNGTNKKQVLGIIKEFNQDRAEMEIVTP